MKKIFIFLSTLLFGSPALAYYLVNFDATSTSNVMDTASGIVGDWLPLIVIVLGIDIAFLIFHNVMNSRKQ